MTVFDWSCRYARCRKNADVPSTKALYCSAACRQGAHRDKLRARGIDPHKPRTAEQRGEGPCPVCRSSVPRTGKGRIRVYCSNACKDKAYTRRLTGADRALSELPAFVAHLAPAPGSSAPAAEVYEYFLRWCRARALSPLSRRALNEALADRFGFSRKRTKRGVVLKYEDGTPPTP